MLRMPPKVSCTLTFFYFRMQPTLCIFARYPEPDQTKTRLIPALGPLGAARLQDRMTCHTLAMAIQLRVRRPIQIELRFTGATLEAMQSRYGSRGIQILPQGEGTLGERLSRAAGNALAHQSPVILIGSDCPSLTADGIDRAFAALEQNQVVLGPATDGGYYLIGLSQFFPALFEGIAWSSRAVLTQTLAAAKSWGIRPTLLEPLSDVDEPTDLHPNQIAALEAITPYHPRQLAITGATGALGGQFLATVLRELPETRVTLLARSASARAQAIHKISAAHPGRITVVEGDLRSDAILSQAHRPLAETDGGLWHFAACTNLLPATPATAREQRDINEGGTSRILQLLAQSDRPGPLFHLSTAYVCGKKSGYSFEHELDDAHGFRNGYEESKYRAEFQVRAAMREGLPGAIFRPSLIVSNAIHQNVGHIANLLCALFATAIRKKRRLILPLHRDSAINAVHADWVVRGLLNLAPFSRESRTYHLTAKQSTDIVSFAEAAQRVLGHFEYEFSADSNPISRRFAPFQPYFDSPANFDRRNLELDFPGLIDDPLDVEAMIRSW